MIEQIVALILAACGAVIPGTLPPPKDPAPKPPRVVEAPAPSPSPGVSVGTDGGRPSPEAWAALRECEAGHYGYAANTGNGYFGAYQFDLPTWRGVGGSGYPHEASPAEQDRRALILWRQRGADPWPVCGRYLED